MATRNARPLRVLLLALALCAPARVRGWAQWQTPYDPDFAQPQTPAPENPPPAPPVPEAQEAPSTAAPAAQALPAVLLPQGQRFLLIDRPDPDHLFETPASTTSPDMARFLGGFDPFEIGPARWQRMRDDYENGTLPSEEEEEALPLPPEELVLSTGASVAPPPPEVEMPTYGTSLSVTGRKVVGVNFSEKRFLHDQVLSGRPKTTNLIDITQQLQLRMQGKVGPKISVNVDYDDTKTDKQDISVVYTGDPNEVVQNASFGDIDLSLPSTEFVSYNKQLFGIRTDLKYKGFKATFIGSRTKGTTKSKQFIGNTQFASLDILDTSYIRRQYYDLSFGTSTRLPIQSGTERVFLSDPRPGGTASNSAAVVRTADDLAVPTSSVTASFIQLAEGSDYTVDYVNGIIQFRVNIDPSFIIAVDYVDANGHPLSGQTAKSAVGGTGLPKLIKTTGDVPVSTTTEVGYTRELKTVYSLGQTQVVRDNGRGNFVLQVLDPQRNLVGPNLNPPQVYTSGGATPTTIIVDFENGLYRLQNPFGIGTSSTASSAPSGPDPDIYAPAPISKRLFHLEYQYRLKTFFLEPNLVLQSEIVLVDGVKLVRNVDYFIDYESGFVTFFNPDRIGPTSVVDVTYEVAPFAGVTSDSILGGRVSYDFNQHFSLGSTLLYQAGSKPPTVPSINDLASSLFIYEGDSQLKDIKLGRHFRISALQGELARSDSNPNLSKFALIDNMEGVKQEDLAPTINLNWQIASNPGGVPSDYRTLNWITADVPTISINPNAQANANQSQKVLNFGYDFTQAAGDAKPNNEVSIVHVFSPTGMDFSQKQTLEVTIFGDNSKNPINFRLGGIDENADGSGTLRTENPECDGILHPGEDVGFQYQPNGEPLAYCDAGGCNSGQRQGDGHIDTESLSQNCRLNPDDGNGDNYGYAASGAEPQNAQLFDATSASTRTVIDFTGWHTFEIPLNISSATAARWTAIKEIRISIKNVGVSSGTLQFARIAVVGNTWLSGQAGDPSTGHGQVATESMQINAVNNVENPNYVPIFSAGGDAQNTFQDLYGSIANLQQQNNSQNLSEQALQLSWNNLTAGTTVYTKRLFPNSINVTQHKRFNFLLFGNADTAHRDQTGKNVFFLRAGTDQNFWEVRVPITFTGWQRVTLDQIDPLGSQIPTTWTVGQAPPGSVIVSSGSPNLQQIGEIVAGMYGTSSAAPTQGAVWLDELYVSDPEERIGTAQKLQADFEVPGWSTFGMKTRSVDSNYLTPTTVVSNQSNRQDSAYLNFTRAAWFPMSFTLNRSIVQTPDIAQTGNLSNLVSFLNSGKVTTWNGTANGSFAYGALPRLSLGYVRARTEYDLFQRLDDRNTYNSAFSYALPHPRHYLPQTIDLNYTFSRYDVSYDRLDVRQAGNFNTNEFTDTYGGRLSFQPWTGSSFNPNAALTQVRERRDDISSGAEVVSRYPKSVNETVGFSSNWRFKPWFNPSVNYTVTNIENNALSSSTVIVLNNSTYTFGVGQIKTINRNATGSISWLLNVSDLWKKTRLFRSLSFANGYQLQDGDVWNNVESGIDSRGALWIRTPLRPRNGVGQRANLTLRDTYNSTQRWQPLEAYAINGRIGAFRTLALTNNYVYSLQRAETTGTPSRTIATTVPDLVASLSQLERLLFSERWMQNGQLNFKYAKRDTTVVGTSFNADDAKGGDLRAIIRRRFDTTLSVNTHDTLQRDLHAGVLVNKTHHQDATLQTTFDVHKFRFTPKVDYTYDVTTLGTGVQQQNVTVITPSVLARADLAMPRGLVLPFTGRTLLFTNRVIWTSTLSMALRSSPVTQADNFKLMTFNTSGDYELAKNLRMTLNAGASREWHKYLPEEDFISYQFGTTLTFQF